jgi:type 1 glutamine amidotransferase
VGDAVKIAAVISLTAAALAGPVADTPYDVLVFSKTAGFRHDSIPAGVQAVRELGAANDFTVTATEDASVFTNGTLGRYEAVVFLNTTGDVLDPAQQTAFENHISAGNGFVGVHSAADTEYDWPFYGELVGAYFESHPAVQRADIQVEHRATAATAHLPRTWSRTDEWYDYRTNPRATARVLATLDESSYSGGHMGDDHPHVWCKTVGTGRGFYTGGGHTASSYGEPEFRAQLLGGIRYAAGRARVDCRPENGYTALYDGSTTGWSQAGPGGFTNADATLTSHGGMGLFWYSAREFSSYSVKLDWKMTGDDNSGVFLGFPPSNDPWSAVNNGYEVQIDATDAPDRTTGSVYGFQAADIPARDAALNPPGEWNGFELLVEGERLRVYLNGVLVNDFTNTDPARSLAGHVGLQNHGDGDDVSFRNVRVRETAPPPAAGQIVGAEGRCVDVDGAGTADGTRVQLWPCNGTNAQQWARAGETWTALGKCLDVSGAGTADGTRVQLWTCNGTAAQNWIPASGSLVNPNSGKCLDAQDGAQLVIRTCHGGPEQRWTVPR